MLQSLTYAFLTILTISREVDSYETVSRSGNLNRRYSSSIQNYRNIPRYIANANNLNQANKRGNSLLATGKKDIGNFFLSPICSIKANIVTGHVAQDRFAPGEAYHATFYKLKKQKKEQAAVDSAGYNYDPPANSNPDLGPVFDSPPAKQSPNIYTSQSSYLPPDSRHPEVIYHDHYQPSHPSSYFPTGYDHYPDSYPEVIVDHHPHFHDHQPVYHPPAKSTTKATTTEQTFELEQVKPQTISPPRIYSYYNLQRNAWWVPMTFYLLFVTYILTQIIRSINRRKVRILD
jgi:hypothetical protein